MIRESQFSKLFEARMEGFRLDNLRNMSFKDKVEYCRQMLGRPIGNGSSRMVFQLDDYSVLKLAKNTKGIAQNFEEYRIGTSQDMDFTPRVLNGSDSENGLWVVSEFVLPAKKQDFNEIYNMDFNDIYEFVWAVDTNRRNNPLYDRAERMIEAAYDKYSDNDDAITLLNNIYELSTGYGQRIGDLQRIQNWGLIQRQYGPELVVLDSGLNDDILKQFYGGN